MLGCWLVSLLEEVCFGELKVKELFLGRDCFFFFEVCLGVGVVLSWCLVGLLGELIVVVEEFFFWFNEFRIDGSFFCFCFMI